MTTMLRPQTDTARVSILETLVHGVVSVSVIASATVLAALHDIDATTASALIGAGIAASGAVTVLGQKVANGKIKGEAMALAQVPGGRRSSDPPNPQTGEHDAFS